MCFTWKLQLITWFNMKLQELLHLVLQVFLVGTTVATNATWHFEDELHKLGILRTLKSGGPMKIETMQREHCKVYNVHVSRFAAKYPTGIACKCDWIMTTTAFYGSTEQPKYIFVATRALHRFGMILDFIKQPFVLISTMNDETIPLNTDKRISLPKGFTTDPKMGLWPRLVNHPKIIHWFVENHTVRHPKVSTLPIGFVDVVTRDDVPEPHILFNKLLEAGNRNVKWEDRKTLMLSNDRVRNGYDQWQDRRDIHVLCENHPLCNVTWNFVPNLTTQFEPNETSFNEDVGKSKFLMMVHGGGLDPCPKLYHSILLGTIPIIESNSLDDAYEELPIGIVPSLKDFLDVARIKETKHLLDEWSAKYAPYYEMHSALRNETLYKLTEEYWWSKVTAYDKQLSR